MKFTLNITHRCNLRCSYCYAGEKVNRDMSDDIAAQGVDLAFSLVSPGQKLDFSFFGGEPLLRMDLIKRVVEKIHVRAGQRQTPVQLSITTNGTLIDDNILDFLADNEIDLCVSVDGPARIHDHYRKYPDGRGSFADLLPRLQAARKRLQRIQVNAVFSPRTFEQLPMVLDFFRSLQIPVVHLNPNISANWKEEHLRKLPAVYDRLAEIYLDAFRKEEPLAVNLFDSKMILFMKDGYGPGDKCSMGQKELAVAASGNIYPCERFIGNDNDPSFVIGNVTNGFNTEKRCQILSARGNRNLACQTCAISKYCMNWCGCTNFHMSGSTDLAGQMLCAMEQTTVMTAKRLFTTLIDDDNDTFLDHLMQYAGEECLASQALQNT